MLLFMGGNVKITNFVVRIFTSVCRVKSPQQLMGSIVKTFLPKKLGVDPGRIKHISLMPCFDKKLEASRADFTEEETEIKDVDCVITTLEIEDMLSRERCDLVTVSSVSVDTLVEGGETRILANTGSASGGYSDILFRYKVSQK